MITTAGKVTIHRDGKIDVKGFGFVPDGPRRFPDEPLEREFAWEAMGWAIRQLNKAKREVFAALPDAPKEEK